MATIHIIAIESGHAPYVLRLAAEAWGAAVTVTWVGNSQQVVDYFATCPTPDLIIISSHGDERGFLLPALAAEIQPRYPYNDVITAADFRTFLRLEHAIVVSLACLGGAPALAEVFLAGGAGTYIGPIGYPDGSATLMYALALIYAYLQNGGDIVVAHQQAAQGNDDRNQFRCYGRAMKSAEISVQGAQQ